MLCSRGLADGPLRPLPASRSAPVVAAIASPERSATAPAALSVALPRFVKRTIDYRGMGERRYLVFLPAGFSTGDRRPVLLFLNGFGENGVDGNRQISNNLGWDVWRMRHSFPFVVIAPQCRPSGNWGDAAGEGGLAMAVLAQVEQEYGTDPDRVYLTGVSSGGSGVWQVASTHPERFAAIAPMGGTGGANAAVLARHHLPTCNIFNDGDDVGLVAFNRDIHEQLLRQGRSPLSMEFHEQGHNAWTRGYATEALYAWLLTHDREKNRLDRAKFSVVEPHELLADGQRIGSVDCHVEDERVLACLGQPEGEPGWLIGRFPVVQGEIHLEAKWSRDTTLCIGLFAGEQATRPIALLALPFAESGRGGVIAPAQDPTHERTPGTGSALSHEPAWLPHPGDGHNIVALLDPVAQRQLSHLEWNDLRISLSGGRLTLVIDGWDALEWRDSAIGATACRLGLLTPGTPDSAIRLRYLRWRSTNGDAPTSPSLRSESNEEVATRVDADSRFDDRPDSETLVGKIRVVWQAREQSLDSVELGWQDRRDGFRLFSTYPPALRPGDKAEGSSERLLVNGALWRHDGWRIPTIALRGRRSVDTVIKNRDVFRTMLAGGQVPTTGEGPLLYTLWANRQQQTQLWRSSENGYPRAVIEGATLSTDASGRPLPLEDLLVEAAFLALRPYSRGPLRDDHDRGAVLEISARAAGTAPAIVLEERLDAPAGQKSKVLRQYWINPQGNFPVERVIELSNGTPRMQWDFDYELSGEEPLVPRRWSGIMLDADGKVAAFAFAERTALNVAPAAIEKRFGEEFPEDTWVVNRVERQTYVARADGSRLAMNDDWDSEVLYDRLVGRNAGIFGWLLLPASRMIVLVVSCIAILGWFWKRRAKRRSRRMGLAASTEG